jgi:hypothetical protein
MAISHYRERKEPITPAGDVDDVIAALSDVELGAGGDDDAGDRVLPELDAAFDELADTVDAPRPTADADASAGDGRLQRERPEFAAVAENTEVDTIPYENAAAFLANTLYAVPPANTRFEWVGAETDAVDPTPDWDLDVDW